MSDEIDVGAAVQRIANSLRIPAVQVRAAVDLLLAGNTLPFIARYRKEATQGLDESALRAIEDAWQYEQELAQRKSTILHSIEQQGLLTDTIRQQVESCYDKKQLEEIYLPFKPKRRTRAAIAREQGLQPLADLLLRQEPLGQPRDKVLARYVDPNKSVPDAESALRGACDIVAETWSLQLDTRAWLTAQAWEHGRITSRVKASQKAEAAKFEMYFDHHEPARHVPSHRLLAMRRGESEGFLRVHLQLDEAVIVRQLQHRWIHNRQFEFLPELMATAEDCYQRLLFPSIESHVLQELKEKADEEAINVFAKNLRELLLSPPAGARNTLGLDPGFRTGCKVAVVDATGKLVAHTTIFPTAPRHDEAGAERTILDLIRQHDVQMIAIGNGTASRETDGFVTRIIKAHQLAVTKVVVSESGASIYSASELAAEEYPHLDVTVRGAISIAHRLQDPLAELVKIDPKAIGVGQYQHDVDQSLLKKCLDREVESCVNLVGVDLNMASPSLLSYVAGIGPKLAQNVVKYRDEHGPFSDRESILRVPKLGKKAFEQAAGFLRVRHGRQPLDNSAVHPESYYVVEKMAKSLQVSPSQLVGNAPMIAKIAPTSFVDERVGLPTIQDILTELAKPGRDPRREFRAARFNDNVNDLADLRQGMILEGCVTNVTQFGAFVDIGVHQDGLIHISELADSFVKDPSEVVAVGDVVRVKVMEVDVNRKRIALSRKRASGE